IGERDEVVRRLESSSSSLDADVRRVKARIAELERAAETTRRDTRTERDLDDARLWLLTESGVQAAAGLRRELSLARPDALPGDTVAADDRGVGGGGHGITTAATLEKMLGTPNVHLVVDGYNVTKTGYGEQALADQRSRLIGQLAG